MFHFDLPCTQNHSSLQLDMKNKVVCFNRTNQKCVWVIVDGVISSFLVSGHRSASITLHGVWSLMMWLQLQMKRCWKEKVVRLGWWSPGKKVICHLKAMRSGYLDTAGEIGIKEGNENEWRVVQGRVQTGTQRWVFFLKLQLLVPTCCHRCRWKRWPRKSGLINESLLDSKKQRKTGFNASFNSLWSWGINSYCSSVPFMLLSNLPEMS